MGWDLERECPPGTAWDAKDTFLSHFSMENDTAWRTSEIGTREIN